MVRPDRRILLHEELCAILGSDQVYYQTPTGRKMHYPAIIYSDGVGNTIRADNIMYLHTDAYSVTLIIDDCETDIPRKLLEHFSMIREDGSPYIGDGLYHYPFFLYY